MTAKPVFLGQGNDSTCAAVAIVNACLHLGLEPPPLNSLVAEMHCDTGGAIGLDATVSRVLGDAVRKCDDPEPLFETGGILTIMHPIFNLHSCLCVIDGYYDDGSTRYTLINSWLGPLVCRNIGRADIEKFLPSRANCKMWAFA